VKSSASTHGRLVALHERPEGGLGETGPSVSPNSAVQARRELAAMMHRVVDALIELPARDQAVALTPVRDLPLLLDAVEAGRLMSISRAKVLSLAASGDIPSVRVGGSIRIPRDSLKAWIDAQTKAPDWLQARGLPRWPDANWSHER
jgi:excisionase family DNA binding protein